MISTIAMASSYSFSSSVALATIDSNSSFNMLHCILYRGNGSSNSSTQERRRKRSEGKFHDSLHKLASIRIDMLPSSSSSRHCSNNYLSSSPFSSGLHGRTSISEARPRRSVTFLASSSPSSSMTKKKNNNRNTKFISHQKASDLQSKFGSDTLRFMDIGGVTVLEVKLRSTGSNIRLLLHEGRITSYKFKMWHGGFEELLQTEVSDNQISKATSTSYDSTISTENPSTSTMKTNNSTMPSAQSSSYRSTSDSSMSIKNSVQVNHSPNSSKFLVSGGMVPSFHFHSNDIHINGTSHDDDADDADGADKRRLCIVEDDQNILYWRLESVKEEADEYIQITLRCDGKNGDFYIQDVVTLSKKMLASAVLIANKGKKPMMFTASISSHLSVRSTEAACVVGLQGCRYYSPSEIAKKMNSRNDNDGNSLFGKLKNLIWQGKLENDDSTTINNLELESSVEDQIPIDLKEEESQWFTEKNDIVIPLSNGIRKLYQSPPKEFRVSDEGFRRSLVVERHGFEEVEVYSPDKDGENPFLSIGCSSSLSPILLSPNGTWKGAQVLIPDS